MLTYFPLYSFQLLIFGRRSRCTSAITLRRPRPRSKRDVEGRSEVKARNRTRSARWRRAAPRRGPLKATTTGAVRPRARFAAARRTFCRRWLAFERTSAYNAITLALTVARPTGLAAKYIASCTLTRFRHVGWMEAASFFSPLSSPLHRFLYWQLQQKARCHLKKIVDYSYLSRVIL